MLRHIDQPPTREPKMTGTINQMAAQAKSDELVRRAADGRRPATRRRLFSRKGLRTSGKPALQPQVVLKMR
jgi:hypothetical protein